MTNTLKYIIIAVVAVLIGLGAGYYLDHQSASQPLVGAVNARPAENYDPYIRTNGGYYSNLPIQTTANLTAGSETVTGANTAATTSIKGNFCIYNGSNYTTVSFASNSTTPVYATSTVCQ